jgi:hypothetical protein
MRVVVLQPMYLPWMGYFGMIDQSDSFVFYDDAQFSRDSWQQRNRVKVPNSSGKTKWIKIPVIENFGQDIQSVQIDNDRDWRSEHWSILNEAYGPEPIPYGTQESDYFPEYKGIFQQMYGLKWEYLCKLNIEIIQKIVKLLGLSEPEFHFSSELDVKGSETDKLINILQRMGADEYISGPGAKDYLEIDRFEEEGINLYWHEFDHPKYEQLYGEFVSHLSIIDVLFNVGPQTTALIREGEADALVREV